MLCNYLVYDPMSERRVGGRPKWVKDGRAHPGPTISIRVRSSSDSRRTYVRTFSWVIDNGFLTLKEVDVGPRAVRYVEPRGSARRRLRCDLAA